jgi:hypothetical protein
MFPGRAQVFECIHYKIRLWYSGFWWRVICMCLPVFFLGGGRHIAPIFRAEAIHSSEILLPPTKPHCLTSQKTTVLIFTALKASNIMHVWS